MMKWTVVFCGAAAALAASSLSGCGGGGCKNDNDCKADRVCQNGECAEPAPKASGDVKPAVSGGTPATSGSPAASAGGAAPGAYPVRAIAAGADASGVWTPGYSLRRDEGDGGLAYIPAAQRCVSKGLALCTETQWSRACAVDATLGQVETWTASPSAAEGFVVRGGSTCAGRRVVDATDTSPARAATCCERAVGIKSKNTNVAFLMTSARRMLEYENALRRRDSAALRKLYDDNVQFFARPMSLDTVIKESEGYFRQFPDQWIIYDVCETSILKDGEDKLVTDCTAVAQRKGELAVVVQQLVRGGPETRIQKLTEPRTFRKFSAP